MKHLGAFSLTVSAAALALAACNSTGSTDTASASSTPAQTDSASSNMPADSGMQTPAPATSNAPNPTVGGAPMNASATIVTNASAAPNLTTLVSAVKAAGLVDTLNGAGPFTVFAPTNDAFSRLAPGTLDNLMKPENKATLVKVLTYHVVPGNISSAQILDKIKTGGGSTTLTTVEGEPLTFRLVNGGLEITGVSGNKSYVQTPDVRQSNGVVHVINGVLVPTLGS